MRYLVLLSLLLLPGILQAAEESDINCQPYYVLKLRSEKSSFSLDIFQHMKDSANAVDFAIAVDQRLYDKVSRGDNLADGSTWGTSFLFGGTPGSIKIKVIDKHMEPCKN